MLAVGAIILGIGTVSISLTDPVWQLKGQILREGPLVVSVDSTRIGEGAAPVPAEITTTPVAEAEAGAAQFPEPPELTASTLVPAEQDAHVLAYELATAPAREKALALDLRDRIALQRRLALLGYNPEGVDGVLGPKSREAIAAWQRDFGFIETGYLDEPLLASIEERSVEQWAAWEAEREARVRYAAKNNAAEPDQAAETASTEGCARNADGVIIERQSFGCDLKGMKEGIGRLFSSFGDEDGGEPLTVVRGLDR